MSAIPGLRRRTAAVFAASTTALVLAVAPAVTAGAAPVRTASDLVQPVDAQHWVNPDDMTWDDFTPIPGTDYANPDRKPSVKTYRAAVVLVDYPNQPFVVTQQPGTSPFGLPTDTVPEVPITREQVPDFYKTLLNVPNQTLNHGHTINEYWMEDTGGRYGVDIDTFGVYRMPGPDYEYHLKDFTTCPAQIMNCTRSFRNDARAAWTADQGADIAEHYDNIFFVGAGMDESSTWQEFGEMRFDGPDDVPDSLGPPAELKAKAQALGIDLPNWAPTRYVSWTSWKAAASMWPNASGNTSIEAESSGRAVYAHEFSHNLGIGDNYNNPYGVPLSRTYSGIWDMLSRGSFNGPGGPHRRWLVPSLEGSQMGAHHMLRNQLKLGTIDPSTVLSLTRDQLREQGTVITTVTAREVRDGAARTSGINIALSGGDRSDCAADGYVGEKAYLCDRGGYDNYTLEVNDRMGSDSFTPDSGVLLAKTKNADRAPFIWAIDANPQDIDLVDFTRPDGTQAKVSLGDYRQLADGLFHAGTHSGSAYEYHDADNGLRFYILAKHRDAAGVLSYDVAVQADHASKAPRRGLAVGRPALSVYGDKLVASMPVTNTGDGDDVFRVRTKISGEGWKAWEPYAVVGAAAGHKMRVTAQAQPNAHASSSATMTVQVASTTDPSKSVTRVVSLPNLR